MSTDDRRQAAKRAAKSDPADPMAQARVEAEHARAGDPMLAWVRSLEGDVVSIEGARINYLGKLVAVYTGPLGELAGLLVDGQRSVWARAGSKPGADYVQEFGEMLVPWAYVHHLTRAPKAWR